MDMLKSISVFYPGGKPNIVDESEDVGGAKVHEGEQRLKVRVIPGVERMDGWKDKIDRDREMTKTMLCEDQIPMCTVTPGG